MKPIYKIKQPVQVELVKQYNMEKVEFEQGRHYYLDKGKIVFTELYLKNRGQCCGSGCKHCPYTPKHQKGNTVLSK